MAFAKMKITAGIEQLIHTQADSTRRCFNTALLLSIFLMMLTILTGCGSAPIRYEPSTSNIGVEQAMATIEKLTMMQHQAWKPDYLEFEHDYMGWDFGQVTTHRANAIAVPVGNTAIAVGRGRGTTRIAANRVYYSDIQKIELLSWRRKMKQWYVVSLVAFRGQRTHVLRTRYLEDAQAYVDALHVLMHAKVESTADTDLSH